MITVHIAGPVVGARQECSRCGYVLDDWTGQEVAVMVEPGQPTPTLSFWPVGEQIAVADCATWVLSDRPLASDERECRATS